MKNRSRYVIGWFPIVLLSLLCPFAGLAQGGSRGKVDVDYQQVAVKDILRDLTKKTGMEFLYNQDEVKQVEPQTFVMKGVSLEQVLDRCFQGSKFGYKHVDGMIVITVKKEEKKISSIKITGKVTEADDEPLVGATVVIKGTAIGVATDVNGDYELNVTSIENLVLIVSFVGMKSMEIKIVAGKTEYNVRLEPENVQVEDVIVTGIFKKSKEAYTGAVTVITDKELKAFGNKNILTSLANIDPAFNMLTNNEWGSNPNKLPEVQIRGAANVSGLENVQDDTKGDLNTPLIIMDGFEISLQRMMDLDDSEVASITLLKDGSATAIYGSRGANGVIVIATKEPQPGKLKLSYTGNMNIEVPDLSDYHLLDAREKLALEDQLGFYSGYKADEELRLKQKYARWLADVERGVDTYWLSKPLRTGVGQRHNVKLEGGDSSFRYAVSLQYNNIAGVMKESKRNNFNGGINLSYYHSNLIFRNNFQVGVNKATNSPYGNFSDYVKLNPYWKPYDDDGKLIKVFDKDDTFWGGGLKWPKNPLYNATLNTVQTTDYTNLVNNFSIEWWPAEGFIVRGSVGITAQFDGSDDFKPASHTDFEADEYKKDDGIFRKGRYAYSTGKIFRYDASLTLSYSKLFAGKHLVYAGMNVEMSDARTKKYNFVVEGFVEESLNFLATALQYEKGGKPTGMESTTRRLGGVVNVNYSYDNRYYADGAFRVDGSSQFGSEKRFAPFFSVGLGWNVHHERFMERVAFVSRLKVRGSFGQTGSQKFNAYQAKAVYAYYLNDRYFQWMGSYQKALGNPDLAWQKTNKWNVGMELDVFNSRLNMVMDVYLERTSNLLSSMDLPYSSGFTSYVQNVGQVENRGFELKATGYLVRDTERRLVWSMTGAIAHNKDKIVKLSEAMKAANEKSILEKSFNPAKIIREGDSQNTIYAVPSLGIDPSNGNELFMKKSGEITSKWAAEDQVACGLSQPKYRGTFSTMVRYRDLSANFSFAYRWGGQLYNQTLASRVENADEKYNVDERVFKNRWKSPGEKTFFKRIDDTSNTYATTRFVQDEKTLSCQNVNLTYDFREKMWLKKNLGIEVLTLSGNMSDLFNWSTVKQERGLSYPFSRRFSFSLMAIF